MGGKRLQSSRPRWPAVPARTPWQTPTSTCFLVVRATPSPSGRSWIRRAIPRCRTSRWLWNPTNPPPAEQPHSVGTIDTIDTRILDSDGWDSVNVTPWNGHPIDGGGVAVIRWYEIGPVGTRLVQFGTHPSSISAPGKTAARHGPRRGPSRIDTFDTPAIDVMAEATLAPETLA